MGQPTRDYRGQIGAVRACLAVAVYLHRNYSHNDRNRLDLNAPLLARLPPQQPYLRHHRARAGEEEGPMRTTFAAAIALVILQYPAYSIERMECGGTEPFWDAKLSDSQVIFRLGVERRTIYTGPHYRAARGASIDFVMSVRATRGRSTLVAFVVNEREMTVADKNGNAPSDPDAYKAYCSDGMSDRGYPFSIHVIVDGDTYTGCCSTSTSPPVGSD